MDAGRRGVTAGSTRRRMTTQLEMSFDCVDRWSRCADDSLLRLSSRARGRLLNRAPRGLVLGGGLEIARGRSGQLAQRAGPELVAQLQRWTRAALERAVPEASSIRELSIAYSNPTFERRLAEQARSLPREGRAMAVAAAHLVQGLP